MISVIFLNISMVHRVQFWTKLMKQTEQVALIIVLLYEVKVYPILDWGRGSAVPVKWYPKLVDFLEPRYTWILCQMLLQYQKVEMSDLAFLNILFTFV